MKIKIQQLISCSSSIKDLRSSNETVAGNVARMDGEISRIKAELESGASLASDVIEVKEQISRACNLLLYGLPGEDGAPCLNSVIGVVDSITRSNDESVPKFNIIQSVRVGKSQPNMPRPLKVTFDNSHIVRYLLRQKKNLLDDPQLKKVKLSDDKTPKQVEELKQLRAVLEERLKSGETDLTIKYIKNSPTIVSTAPKN